MKISYVKPRGIRTINISHFTNIRRKLKNKMFDEDNIAKAMDYAVSIEEDLYIETCSSEIQGWIVRNKHEILKKKSWIFA